jgi:hypothetical protein
MVAVVATITTIKGDDDDKKRKREKEKRVLMYTDEIK